MIDRSAFRRFPLDGALLHFQPASGIHIRIENEATRHLKRCAPRVVMFGITNKCNLSCDFCSRDIGRSSTWTVASATATLRDLATAGTLEVAFGGGEPFAFRGFSELVADLYASTPLVLNVTTNGTLISEAGFASYAGRFGQVRVSIYEGSRWRDGCRVLAAYGQRWGANLIVDDAVLMHLPALLAELAALGCHDLSLLAYIGPDTRKHLSFAGRASLAAMIQDAPLACRLSVCFGDEIAVERLFDGADGNGDCGAGLDFVSITPDQKIMGCSFQEGGLPAANAQQILAAWQHERNQLLQPALRKGCARGKAGQCGNDDCSHAGRIQAVRKPPPITIWQAYSGNNSGECVMVAKFETVADANAYLAQLLPTWQPDSSFSPEWKQLLLDERICCAPIPEWQEMPSELLAIGRSVIALSYGIDDQFPQLRALAWKKGAHLLPDGVHVHGSLYLLAVVRAANENEAFQLATRKMPSMVSPYLHGNLVMLCLTLRESGAEHWSEELLEQLSEQLSQQLSLRAASEFLQAFAGKRPLAAEVVFETLDHAAMIAAKKQLGSPMASIKRLALKFYGQDAHSNAARFAQLVAEGNASVCGDCVLVSGIERRKRLAVLAYRYGAEVSVLDGARVCVWASFQLPTVAPQKGRRAQQPVIDLLPLEQELHAKFSEESCMTLGAPDWLRHGAYLTLHTSRPDFVLSELSQSAKTLGAELSVGLHEIDALAFALRRLIADVQS